MEERNIETVELASIVGQVRADLADEIEGRKAKVDLEDSRKVHVVPFQFRQLLYNLISYSLKYPKEEKPPLIQIGQRLKTFQIGWRQGVIGWQVCSNRCGRQRHWVGKRLCGKDIPDFSAPA